MRKVDNNEIEILGSSVLLFEVSMIPDDLKRVSVEQLIARVATEISRVTDSNADHERLRYRCHGCYASCNRDSERGASILNH